MIKTRERRLASNITRNYFNVLIWKEFKYRKLLEENLPTFEDYAPAVEIAFKGCNIICALRTFNDSKYLNRVISDSALGSRCMVKFDVSSHRDEKTLWDGAWSLIFSQSSMTKIK